MGSNAPYKRLDLAGLKKDLEMVNRDDSVYLDWWELDALIEIAERVEERDRLIASAREAYESLRQERIGLLDQLESMRRALENCQQARTKV